MQPSATPAIRRATISDVNRVARLLAAAYDNDPVFTWLARRGRAHAAALQSFFTWVVRERAVPHGETWMTSDGYAAAVWIPPFSDGRRPPATWRDDMRTMPVILRLTGMTRFNRGAAMAAALEQAHPKEPFFYLAFFGVAPRFQGTGIGTALLAQTIARVDAAGAPAFLENSNPRNLKLYERAGFSVVNEVVIRRGAPPLFAMWRPARPRP